MGKKYLDIRYNDGPSRITNYRDSMDIPSNERTKSAMTPEELEARFTRIERAIIWIASAVEAVNNESADLTNEITEILYLK
jgi:hypothetical protein